jgi:hypothetical protein
VKRVGLSSRTWDNQGEWHIDHILPCVAFDLEDPVEQQACFYYKNLQAMWALDNSRKGGVYSKEDKERYMTEFYNARADAQPDYFQSV